MLDPSNGGESQQDEKWKVFALLEKNKQGLVLERNSEVLYQVYILYDYLKVQKVNACMVNGLFYGRIQGTGMENIWY
jgi:hypothetical protein